MRNLCIFRERALFCFGNLYYVVFNKSKEDVIAKADSLGFVAVQQDPELAAIGIRNGARVTIEIPETEGRMLIAVYRESSPLLSEVVELPEGSDDLSFTIKTDYNGRNKMSLNLLQA